MSAQEWLDRADAYIDSYMDRQDQAIAGPAVAALRAVLNLHPVDLLGGIAWCRRCQALWPCATVRRITEAGVR